MTRSILFAIFSLAAGAWLAAFVRRALFFPAGILHAQSPVAVERAIP